MGLLNVTYSQCLGSQNIIEEIELLHRKYMYCLNKAVFAFFFKYLQEWGNVGSPRLAVLNYRMTVNQQLT